MTLSIEQSNQACGARVTGLDLTKPMKPIQVEKIRQAWLKHHVLVFPKQRLTDSHLERFTLNFGPFGIDTFFGSIPGHPNIAAITRESDEKAPIFAETWHTDWSFQPEPPQGTCLYGIDIPPKGGDTLFANQHQALEQMPNELRAQLENQMAIHSAKLGYSLTGAYGEADQSKGRSMDIRPSDRANETHSHPIIRPHPETGRLGLFGTFGYIIGIEGMADEVALNLLLELQAWQSKEEFQYRHQWEPEMLVMWDNRSVLHRATGGYEGYSRRLHRTTIGAAPSSG